MKFAVTGGAGFIGSHIVKKLVKENHSVIVIDNLHTGRMENLKEVNKYIKFYKIDVLDEIALRDVLSDVDGIFHEAALTIVQESFSKPEEYFDVNVKGMENVLKIAMEYNVKVVYASSSSVYGNTYEIPIKENHPKNPINPYGETKLEDEKLAKKYSEKNMNIIGLRYFNVYGKGQTGSYAGVITKFMNKIKQKESPIINGDGSQIRDFIHVEDVANVNLLAMQSNVKNGFFNIGTGKTTSIKELAKIMISLSKLNIDPIHIRPMEGDVNKSQADTEAIKKMLKWKYKIELKEGLEKLFKQNELL